MVMPDFEFYPNVENENNNRKKIKKNPYNNKIDFDLNRKSET